jgi:hypothetical protein
VGLVEKKADKSAYRQDGAQRSSAKNEQDGVVFGLETPTVLMVFER